MRRKSKERQAERGAEQAREKCLRLLSRRAHSSAELRKKLRLAGFEGEVIERVLADLTESGLLNDEEFARSWVADRKLAGGTGRRKLAWELRRKGIGRSLIARVLAEDMEEETELSQAMELARKKIRAGAQGAVEAMRLRRFLLGRGYGFEVVDKVLQSLPLHKEAGEMSYPARGEGETFR